MCMRTANPSHRRSAGDRIVLVFAGLMLATTSSLWAQVAGDEGIPLGPLYLRPVLTAEYSSDDNVFRRSEADPEDVQSDRIQRLVGRLAATLPFHNSSFTVFGEGSRFSYQEQNSLSRETTTDAGADLLLSFSSFDKINIRERFSRGFSNVQEFAGDELVFQGEPYRFNEVSFGLERAEPRHRGWNLRLVRRDLTFDNELDVDFFDYRGFLGSAEYREPLTSKLWFIAGYSGRRFDHFETNDQATVGVPFRSEIGDGWFTGLRGDLGKNQPFVIQVGYGSLKYDLIETESFSGLIGRSSWQLRIGPDSRLLLAYQRRVLPSFYSSYYLQDEVTVGWRQTLALPINLSTSLRFSSNVYGCGQVTTAVCTINNQGVITERRKDEYASLELSVIYAAHPRIGLRFQGVYRQRFSSDEIFEYDNTVLTVSIVTGWFNQ